MSSKDGRLYAKFTLDFPDSHKILPLSDAAFRALVEMTIWSRRQMTDGFLARRLAVARWSLDVLAELCSNDDENPSLIEHETGYQIHDFAAHQDTRAEIEARSARNKAAGQKGGLARAKQSAKRPASKSLSETQAETETETETDSSVVTLVEGGSGGSVKPNRAQGTRLPGDWMPRPDVVAQMRSEHPHIDPKAEHAKFVDYWTAQPGARGRKTDWNATWRNWIRKAAERAPRAPNNPKPSTSDAAFAATQALKDKPAGRLEITP